MENCCVLSPEKRMNCVHHTCNGITYSCDYSILQYATQNQVINSILCTYVYNTYNY